MDELELARRRTQMGLTTQLWVTHAGPQAVGDVDDGYWLMLTGAPSPDVNMALVHDGEPATLLAVSHAVEATGFTSMFVLAGGSVDSDLGGGWEHVGAMPFMSLRLADARIQADARVRQAGADDFDAVSGLISSAFGLAREVAEVCANLLRHEPGASRIWILEEEEQAVSTVTTALIDDAVCVWCMATPERFGRRRYGRSVLGHALLSARDGGAAIGLLGASPAGRPLYEATGWQTLEEWRLHIQAETSRVAR